MKNESELHTTHSSFAAAAAAFGTIAEVLTARVHNPNIIFRTREEVLYLLDGESEIRVFIDGTKNLGHQVASLNLLTRLLEITQFRGDVIVLYADYGQPLLGATAEKIAFLLQQDAGMSLDSINISHHDGARIRFVPYEGRKSLPRCARFGFTGGADDMGVNYAAELGVDWFLRLQPFLWDDESAQKSDPYYESSRIETADGRMFYLIDACPFLRHLPLKYSTTARIHSSSSCVSGADVIASLEKAGYLIWPIYGLHHFHSLSSIIAFNLACTALLLSARFGRPIALLSLCPLNEDLSQSMLLTALKNSLYKAPSLANLKVDLNIQDVSIMLKVMLDAIPRPAQFEFVHRDMVHSHLSNTNADTKGAKTILIQHGLVSPSVFEHILRNSPLPPVIEGQSSANLLLNLGRPYFHILRPEHAIKNAYISGIVAPEQVDLSSRMNGIVQSLISCSYKRPSAAENLAQLALSLSDLSSDEAKYFTNISRWLARDENDKLFIGLVALYQVMQIS